jgi:hypothetical protein
MDGRKAMCQHQIRQLERKTSSVLPAARNFSLHWNSRLLRWALIFAEHQRPVSHDPTRKHFFAKLIGLIAAAGLAPRLLAQSQASRARPVTPPQIELRPESRAVARRADSV